MNININESKSVAFFDVDETLINMKSMFDFLQYWYQGRNEEEKLKSYMSNFKIEVKNGTSREQLNKGYYRQFKGVNYSDLVKSGEKWFSSVLDENLFINESIEALKRHQTQNIDIVFVSGSMFPLLSPIAKHLGVKHILCAPIELNSDGIVTGEIGTPQTIGNGKKEAILHFCNKKNIDPEKCYAYGDDVSDIPMMEITGHPICVGKKSNLSIHAILHGWKII